MSKKSLALLTRGPEKRPEGRTVTLRLKVWAAAKRSAVRRLETRLAEIVTQTLRLAAKTDAEGGA